jgi:N6-L-threonylcarbamoyladenine synthase
MSHNSLDFSFSGIKTAVLNYVRTRSKEVISDQINDIVASFQEAIVDVLVIKTLTAALSRGVSTIVLAGGVASNTRLRTRLKDMAEEKGLRVFIPSPILCTDNAAMIAGIGNYYLRKGITSSMDLNAVSRWPR